MENGHISAAAAAAADRCVKLKILLPGSGVASVNETVLIPEGTPVDAAEN